jgi:hypothetical protein
MTFRVWSRSPGTWWWVRPLVARGFAITTRTWPLWIAVRPDGHATDAVDGDRQDRRLAGDRDDEGAAFELADRAVGRGGSLQGDQQRVPSRLGPGGGLVDYLQARTCKGRGVPIRTMRRRPACRTVSDALVRAPPLPSLRLAAFNTTPKWSPGLHSALADRRARPAPGRVVTLPVPARSAPLPRPRQGTARQSR